ncbi:hypothetical protein B0T22DRAFT_424359 [Podospora appendiculata]|uniref:NAD-dependent epimerase/dehydratase domain-containing protein n=1 Tax=Podospora appendiculata TaxID=314037 RepID=A0AAE0XD87_9PEZI|nr:hypothetical protein B0T22DRAFT_424359 [Podospora appendiculata]
MTNKGLVLVTGANGYIAARTVEAFLAAGYSVRGTARSRNSTHDTVDALKAYADRLEIAEIPDITVPGAFDEAVKGVDAIAHLAAPIAMSFTDPEPVMKGAIDGITRVLESAAKEPSIKSFVFMSSVAAIRSEKPDGYVFTEADWNTQAEDIVAQQGKDTPGPVIYYASKTAAEKALWKFRDEHKPAFSITALNPCFVAGPPLVPPTTVDKIPFTTKMIWDVYTGVPLHEAGITSAFPAFVDVRDVARMVVFAVDHPEKADGERFLLGSHYAPPQAVADILREEFPERRGAIHEGKPREGYYLPGYTFPPDRIVYDGSKAVRVSGRGYILWEETVRDTVLSVGGVARE